MAQINPTIQQQKPVVQVGAVSTQQKQVSSVPNPTPSVPAQTASPSTTPQKKAPWWVWVLIVLGILVVGAVIAAYFLI